MSILNGQSYVYITVLDHSFQKHVKVYEKLTSQPPRIRMCADQQVRNISFSRNYKHVLNGWSLSGILFIDILHINIPTTIKKCKVPFIFFFFFFFFTLVAILNVNFSKRYRAKWVKPI